MLRILGTRVDPVTLAEAMHRVDGFLADPGPHHIVTGNSLMLLEAEQDRELRKAIEQAALVLPESSGVYWASRQVHRPLREFIPGIDFLHALCDRLARQGGRVFLLGARPGVAPRAAAQLQKLYRGLRIAGTHHGYFSPDEVPSLLEQIRHTQPLVLFVGLAVPEQEKWIARHLRETGARIVMGVGGSFDVIAGELNRAPVWLRRLGMEWSFRLVQEPWRWRRMQGLPRFVWRVMRTRRDQARL